MARSFKRREPMAAVTEINVTPLIDLAFSLLIIFMITTPLLEQSIEIKLPLETARMQPPSEEQFETISIDSTGRIFWGDQEVTLPELDLELYNVTMQSEPPAINLRADASLQYQRVIDVIDMIKKHKLSKLSLDTRAK